MTHFSFLQLLTTQACNHIPNNQVALQAHRQSQVPICNTHNSWLQSRSPNSCNHTLAQLFFSFFCSHRNKPADFAMTHLSFFAITYYPGLQSYFKQPSFFFQPHRQSEVSFFLQTHIIPSYIHSCKLVAITHWFSFLFLFCSHRNKPADFAMRNFSFLQSHTTQACNHSPNNQVAFQPQRQNQVSFFAITHAK
jgi:hypothetical protein